MSKKDSSKRGNDETHGHINLQYGLDIIINCEVSQKDPAGITVPYRLLVPTLWYQGDGDLNDTPFRKKSWMSRLGSINQSVRKKSDLAKGQGGGEWGRSYSDESRSQSTNESEAESLSSHDVGYVQRNRNPVEFSAALLSPVEIGETIASDRFAEKDGLANKANTRSAAWRLEGDAEGHIGGDDGLARRKSRGYDGIDAYKESRWRRFL